MPAGSEALQNNARKGIIFVIAGMFCISANDMLIKHLSGNYPLHEMVFVRSVFGLMISLIIVQFEGGFTILRTNRVGLQTLRGLLMVMANLTFFSALAVVPLAEATAIFFVAPLFITLMSIFFLGEKVGPRRFIAVAVGFAGVLAMLRPGSAHSSGSPGTLVLLLPVAAAFGYAAVQILTRKLGVSSKASALAVYMQLTFIAVSGGFWFVTGDGRYGEGQDSEILIFLLRAWTWPSASDWPLFGLLGLLSALVGYTISQAYRSADAATIAPFEYVALPMSIFWGWAMFGELPGLRVMFGVLLIAGSGLYVFLRERKKSGPG